MPSARHLLAILEGHVQGDSSSVYSTALQVAAREAQLGHAKVATRLRELVEKGRARDRNDPGAVPLAQPRGELANLVAVTYPRVHLASMTLAAPQRERLERVLLEQTKAQKIRAHNLAPRRKLLLVGPPGTGKTMTVSAIAGELRLPVFTILLEGVITKFMGETAQKLRAIFEAMRRTKGVYFFDEFDAIGARRTAGNDVGEVRRILNSFLSLLENDDSESIVVAATNHPALLDPALFRRFDDVIAYHMPDAEEIQRLMQGQLVGFQADVAWPELLKWSRGLSHADIVRATQEAAKTALLEDRKTITAQDLTHALEDRQLRKPES